MHDGFVNNSIKTTFRFSIKKKMEEKIRNKTTIKEINKKLAFPNFSLFMLGIA